MKAVDERTRTCQQNSPGKEISRSPKHPLGASLQHDQSSKRLLSPPYRADAWRCEVIGLVQLERASRTCDEDERFDWARKSMQLHTKPVLDGLKALWV